MCCYSGFDQNILLKSVSRQRKLYKQVLKYPYIYHWKLLPNTACFGIHRFWVFPKNSEAFWEFAFERALTSSTGLHISHNFGPNLYFTALYDVCHLAFKNLGLFSQEKND